jgi:hypothetical protein
MSKEQVLELISAWSTKVRQARLLRSMSAKWTALGFATCIASLAEEAGVEYPDDVRDFLKREGVL